MRTSDTIIPRIKIANAARRIGALKRAENTDGAKVKMTSASTLVSRSERANLRMNCFEKVGTIAARASVIGPTSGMSSSLSSESYSVGLGEKQQRLSNRGSARAIRSRAIVRSFARDSAFSRDDK